MNTILKILFSVMLKGWNTVYDHFLRTEHEENHTRGKKMTGSELTADVNPPPCFYLSCLPSAVRPASAQASDIIFGAALAAALPRHAQGKVPLLLAGRRALLWCWSRRRLQLRRPLLLPEKSHEVSQRGEGAERGGDFWELCAGRPALHVVLRRSVTGGTPLERVWRRRV